MKPKYPICLYNNLIIIITILSNLIILIKTDCGFPSIPVHSKIRPLSGVYYEDDIVEYYCEFNDMILIGNKHRQCSKSLWKGEIPQCVREIARKYLDGIEVTKVLNHTISKVYNIVIYRGINYLKDYERYQLMTFYANYESNECLKSETQNKKLEWKVKFKEEINSVNYVEIVIYNSLNLNQINQSQQYIANIFVNSYRECKLISASSLDINEKLIKYGYFCHLKSLNSYQKVSDYIELKYRDTSNLTIKFAVNQITVCELHVYQTYLSRWSACGSPDLPLHSNYTPVYSEEVSDPTPIGYRFKCEFGFELIGNPVAICGINGKWLDEFPKCKPIKTCDLMDPNSLRTYELSVEHKNLYSADGNITAINGSQAIFSCHDYQDIGLNLTMIGDSIRFCNISGNWTGEEPVCIADTDLTIYLSEMNEESLKTESILPEFAHFQHRPNDCGIPAIPVYSKIYSFDDQLLRTTIPAEEERINLMPSYPNGSTIIYVCESRFLYMTNDFEARICVNGSWTGHIGKCFQSIGGTDVAYIYSIIATEDPPDPNGYRTLGVYSSRPESITESDTWNFIESDRNNCSVFDVKRGQKQVWRISLSRSVRISYFAVKFETSRIFHHLTDEMIQLHKSSELSTFPISADISTYYYQMKNIKCEIFKVIEASDWLTQISFRCNEDLFAKNQPNYGYPQNILSSTINLHIDPDLFHQNFNSTNIALCGLIIFKSAEDCGSPEIVLNAEITFDHSSDYVQYKCHNGYKLNGSDVVRCGKYGQWMDKFPRCELYKLCDLVVSNISILQRQYYNTLINGDEEVAVLGTIVKYSCLSEVITDGKHILIGPRTAVCTASGRWSAPLPQCRDEKTLKLNRNKDSSLNPLLLLIVSVILLFIVITTISLYMSHRFGYTNRLTNLINKKRVTKRRSSTFISYNQQTRDSVMSY